MRYHGGKTKGGKRISIILKRIIDNNDGISGYCEPFCGACGVLKHMVVGNEHLDFSGGDSNKSIVKMWSSLVGGWEPDISNVTKESYILMRGDGNSTAQKGFIGHVMSFGGVYFKSYVDELLHTIESSKNNVITESILMKDVVFSSGDYTQFSHIKNNIIFCDPPYQKNSNYYDDDNKRVLFDHESFWVWCKNMKKDNIIVVNEMSGIKIDGCNPIIIELPARNISYRKNTNKETESLYIYGDKLHRDCVYTDVRVP